MTLMKGFYTGDRWKRHVQSQLPKPPNGHCPNCKSPRVLKIGEAPQGDIVQCLNCGADGIRVTQEGRKK